MSHAITQTNGKWEFAYTGQAPWHGLGQQLPAAATMDDILKAAGLDWIVLSEPVYLADGSQVPGYAANRRSDTKDVLGIVSDDFKVYQNTDSLGFAEALVGEAEAMYHTAGSIHGGRRVFATAKLPGSIVVLPGDVVDQYLLIVNAHDGTSRLHIRFTGVRVVCANTLGQAMAGAAQHQYSVIHLGNLQSQLEEARKALGIAVRYFKQSEEAYQELAATKIDDEMFEKFNRRFAPLPKTDDADVVYKVKRRREAVKALYAGGIGTEIPGVGSTAWGAYNAAIEYIDRVRTARKDGAMRKGAAVGAVFGQEAQGLRQRAWDAATRLIRR